MIIFIAFPLHKPLLGQFWNVPLSVAVIEGYKFVLVNAEDAENHRRIPAFEYDLTWDQTQRTCYYVGNIQGGPESFADPRKSVIEGVQSDYQMAGLFETAFTFKKFDESAC